MDGRMSHNPATIPQFIRCLNEEHKCVFESRFINGGTSLLLSHHENASGTHITHLKR